MIDIVIKILIAAAIFLCGYVYGIINNKESMISDIEFHRGNADKYYSMYLLCNQWLIAKNKKSDIVSYLNAKDVHTVAIYGMSEIGELLYEELANSSIQIKYGIDCCLGKKCGNISVFSVEENLEPVDLIIVTPIYYYKEIEESLKKKEIGKIISIEEIIYDI